MNIQQNYSQQLPVRNFRVNYNDGFALLQSTELLGWLVENNSGVHVVEVPSPEQAYVEACRQFVQNEWTKNPYKIPILPRFEDVIRSPYHAPRFVVQIPTPRFFATVNPDFIGIYDNVQEAVEFVEHFKPSGLKELSSADEAKLWLNKSLVLPMVAMSAYVTDPIEYILNLPLNEAVPVYYRQWWQQHLPAINNLPFACPQFLIAPKEV